MKYLERGEMVEALEAWLRDIREGIEKREWSLKNMRLEMARLRLRIDVFGEDDLSREEIQRLDSTLPNRIGKLEDEIRRFQVRLTAIEVWAAEQKRQSAP